MSEKDLCEGCPNLAWQDKQSGYCTGEHRGNCYGETNESQKSTPEASK